MSGIRGMLGRGGLTWGERGLDVCLSVFYYGFGNWIGKMIEAVYKPL